MNPIVENAPIENRGHRIHVAFVSYSDYVPADLKRISQDTLRMPASESVHVYNLTTQTEDLLAALEANKIHHLILKKSLKRQFALKVYEAVDESSPEYITVNYAEFKSALEAFEGRRRLNLQDKQRKAPEETAATVIQPHSDAAESCKSKDTRGGYKPPRDPAKGKQAPPQTPPQSRGNNLPSDTATSPQNVDFTAKADALFESSEDQHLAASEVEASDSQSRKSSDHKADIENLHDNAAKLGTNSSLHSKDVAVATGGVDPPKGTLTESLPVIKAVATDTKIRKPHSAGSSPQKAVATNKRKSSKPKYPSGLVMRFRVTPEEKEEIESTLGDLKFSDAAREVFLNHKNLSDILKKENSLTVVYQSGRQITNLEQILDHRIDGVEEPALEIRKIVERFSTHKFRTSEGAEQVARALEIQGERLNCVSADLNTRRASGRSPDADRQIRVLRSIRDDLLLIERDV